MSKGKSREEREKERKEREQRRANLRQALAKGREVRPGDIVPKVATPQFDGDIHEIQNSYAAIRDLIGLTAGPLPLSFVENKDPRSARLIWAPLAQILNQDTYLQKRTIAEHLLSVKDGNDYLLRRGANVLLAPPGSATVFVVALALAEHWAQHCQSGQSERFRPFTGEWHTDMVLAALLLARLPAQFDGNPIGPRVFLGGCDVSPLAGINNQTMPWRVSIKTLQQQVADRCSTLVLGCHRLDRNGDIYTLIENHEAEVEEYLNTIGDDKNNRVIVVAHKQKLGGDPDGHRINYRRDNRDFVIVTDSDPELERVPAPFRAIFWPGGRQDRNPDRDPLVW